MPRGGGREFAHALRTVARAYRVPDAGAGDVLAAAARVLDIAPATHAALERIARDFDRAARSGAALGGARLDRRVRGRARRMRAAADPVCGLSRAGRRAPNRRRR